MHVKYLQSEASKISGWSNSMIARSYFRPPPGGAARCGCSPESTGPDLKQEGLQILDFLFKLNDRS